MSQKKIKLFFVIDSISLGGAERVISQLASNLVSRGLDCTLITFDKTDDPNFYPVDTQIKRIRLGDKDPRLVVTEKISYLRFLYISLLRLFTLRSFTKEARDEQHVFISFLTHINIVTAAACLFTNTKLIVSERTCPKFSAGWFGKILRSLVYLRADRIVTQTNDGKNFLPRQLRQKVLTIANPIKQHPPGGISAEAHQHRIILGVGRLSREKGFDRLIRIFQKAQNRFADLHLIIVGDGPEKENLTALIAKLKLEAKVSLPGAQANLEPFYEKATIFCLTSFYEGFPNALCEAMSFGIACIAMDCPTGPSEIIDHEINGLLVENGNETKFAEQLIKLIEHDEIRKRISNRAPSVVEKYSQSKINELWFDTINKVI